MIPQTLGHYRIVAKIGEGGMGEVYRARDTKLDRDVALKVLPEAFTSDPERVARFEREAKVLASLNHPNIGAIHGSEESGETRALVLELIEGPTLADRIAQGAIPIDEALPIATQIADALEAAHEAGVIHRDLKPANVKLRPDGTVKVLDFGLAKALAPTTEGDPSQSPTLTAAATQMGVIMGTAAYMAPEQAKGKAADRRVDIWAFGAVLYEMLSGRRAFVGDDVSDTMAAVLRAEADWDALPSDTPARLRQLLRRCLERDPRRRVRDIGDARLAMEGAFETPGAAPAESAPEVPRPAWQRAVPIATAVVASFVLGGLAVWALGRDVPAEAVSTRFTLTLPESARMLGGSGQLLAISPDGRTLIYRADRDDGAQLFRRSLDAFETAEIPGTDGAQHPFVSADGQWLGFDDGQTIQRVALAGGTPQTLTTGSIRGASWGRDDRIVYSLLDGHSLLEIPASGGEPTTLFTSEDGRNVYWPHVLEDSDAVFFTMSDGPSGDRDLHLLDRSTGVHRLVVPDAAAGQVLPTGHLVFVRGNALWAVPFDRRRLELVGTPVPVLTGVRVEAGGAMQLAVSEGGALVYLTGADGSDAFSLLLVDRSGEEQAPEIVLPAGWAEGPTLSPAEQRATVALANQASGEGRVVVWDLTRGALTPFPALGGAGLGAPVWSTDGRHLAFNAEEDGQWAVFRQASDGSGAPERLLVDESFFTLAPSEWSADGAMLLLTGVRRDTSTDVGMVATDGTGDWVPLVATAADEALPTLSPDGRWMAYVSMDDAGRADVIVERFPELGGRQVVSVGGGFSPVWSKESSELFYIKGAPGRGESLMRVSVEATDTRPPELRLGPPEALFTWQYLSTSNRAARSFDVTSDGQRFLAIGSPGGEVSSAAEINVVLDWFTELNELVPVP